MSKNLVPLNLPEAPLKLARKGEDIFVWDEIRKKHLVLTPEEWVRQHFVFFLLEMGYPKSSIALEGGFYLNKKLQRSDIVIYRDSKPWMLVECKAPQVNISQETFDQASRYNLKIDAGFVAVTNGLEHYYARVDHVSKSYSFIKEIPPFRSS